MRIGLDIDGVMYKWQKTALYMLRDVLPDSPYKEVLKSEEDWVCWDWPMQHVSKEHWQWLWTEGVKLGLFRYGHLYPGTIQAVRKLATIGDVILITHRPKEAVTDTLSWLGHLNLPLGGLHLLTNVEPKSLVRPMCDVYLDDKPDNIEDLLAHTAAEKVCLMRRPWNTMYTPDDDRGAVVNGWTEFITLIKENIR